MTVVWFLAGRRRWAGIWLQSVWNTWFGIDCPIYKDVGSKLIPIRLHFNELLKFMRFFFIQSITFHRRLPLKSTVSHTRTHSQRTGALYAAKCTIWFGWVDCDIVSDMYAQCIVKPASEPHFSLSLALSISHWTLFVFDHHLIFELTHVILCLSLCS